MKAYNLFIIFSILPCFAISQSQITLSIRDSKNNSPLSNATLQINKTSYSSDINGIVKIDNCFQPKDSVFVYYLGYKKNLSVFSFVQQNNIIFMHQDTFNLSEVVITEYPFDNAKRVLKKVLKKIPENYFSTPYTIDIYHRSRVKINDTLLKYNEISSLINLNKWNEVKNIKIINALVYNKINNVYKDFSLFLPIETSSLNFSRHIHTGVFSPWDYSIDSVYYLNNKKFIDISGFQSKREYSDTIIKTLKYYKNDSLYTLEFEKKDTLNRLPDGSYKKIKATIKLPEYAITFFQIEYYKSIDTSDINNRIEAGGDVRDVLYRNECFYFMPLNKKWVEYKHTLLTSTINGKTKHKRGFYKDDIDEYFVNEFYIDNSYFKQDTGFYSLNDIYNQSYNSRDSFGFPKNIETEYWKTYPYIRDKVTRDGIIKSLSLP